MCDAADPRRSDAALMRLNRRIERRPRDGLSILQRAVIHQASGRISEAIEDYSQLLLLRPSHVAALMNRARLWDAVGESESAIADLDQLLDEDPSNGAALVLRASLQFRLGRRDDAIADLERTQDATLGEQEDRLERIRLRIELKHDLRSGESEMQKEIEIDTKSIPVRYLRGVLRSAMGRPAEAREDSEAVANSVGEAHEDRCHRACALLNLSRWRESTAEFARCLAEEPQNLVARKHHALALFYSGEFDQSLAEWNELIQQQPLSSDSLVYRAMLHSDAGRYHEAEQDLRLALYHAPKSPAALSSLAWLYGTCPDARLRNGSEALSLATQACEQSEWNDGNYLGTLAAAYAECDRFAEAIRWGEQSRSKLSPEGLASAEVQLALYRSGEPYRSSPGEFFREVQASLAEAARADG